MAPQRAARMMHSVNCSLLLWLERDARQPWAWRHAGIGKPLKHVRSSRGHVFQSWSEVGYARATVCCWDKCRVPISRPGRVFYAVPRVGAVERRRWIFSQLCDNLRIQNGGRRRGRLNIYDTTRDSSNPKQLQLNTCAVQASCATTKAVNNDAGATRLTPCLPPAFGWRPPPLRHRYQWFSCCCCRSLVRSGQSFKPWRHPEASCTSRPTRTGWWSRWVGRGASNGCVCVFVFLR